MIIISKYIVPKGFTGITLYPFIFLKNSSIKNDNITINHEKIHLRQQIEMLVIPFYIFYVIEWFFKFLKYKNSYLAYRNLSFEREAYTFETDINYLKNRKFWAFIKHL
ncbi:conserved protein of unknown function [Tenacibaculum jejuense]|uniref:DUF4157 domain-containing protein n=1 Tax=Tenacibaculum jejuense TaxID=584609 RepID=A0A238UCC1_9FLAO|nr:conserved protein of unknown function [Tenacibaculum jejuense]